MSPISLLGRSAQIYADAAALGIHIPTNHSLFEGDELYDKTLLEDLRDQVYMLRGCSGEPVAHMPVSQIQASWALDVVDRLRNLTTCVLAALNRGLSNTSCPASIALVAPSRAEC